MIQYDFGKATAKGWQRTGMLLPPPQVLLRALSKLRAEHELQDSQIPSILDTGMRFSKKFAENFKHPGMENDHLYKYEPDSNAEIAVLDRPHRGSDPEIHYGTIASGNLLVKDAKMRSKIISDIGQPCICLEMEAAGLMNNFPCLVVRGICGKSFCPKADTSNQLRKPE